MIYQEVKDKLQENSLTIAFAESMTGGLATYKLAEIPGASHVLKGSLITYSIDSKINQLDVPAKLIEKYRVVSSEVAEVMAKNVMEKIGTDIGIGITGDAGPTLQDVGEKRVAYYAICTNDFCKSYQIIFNQESRVEAQKETVEKIYQTLINLI